MQIAENVMYRELDDEIVFLDLNAGQYFSLDGVGSRFWRLLEAGNDRNQCLETLGQEYEVDGSRLAKDIDELISRLHAKGILVDVA